MNEITTCSQSSSFAQLRIGEYTYALKWVCKPRVNVYSAFGSVLGHAQGGRKPGSPDPHASSRGRARLTLPAHFSCHTGDGRPFCGLLSAMSLSRLCFLWTMSLFETPLSVALTRGVVFLSAARLRGALRRKHVRPISVVSMSYGAAD